MKARTPALLLAAPLLVATTVTGNFERQPDDGTMKVNLGNVEFGPGEGKRTLHYQLIINERGRVTACRVVRSSDDDLFDKSVCKELKKNSRFDRVEGKLFGGGDRYYSGYFYAEPPRRAAQ